MLLVRLRRDVVVVATSESTESVTFVEEWGKIVTIILYARSSCPIFTIAVKYGITAERGIQ